MDFKGLHGVIQLLLHHSSIFGITAERVLVKAKLGALLADSKQHCSSECEACNNSSYKCGMHYTRVVVPQHAAVLHSGCPSQLPTQSSVALLLSTFCQQQLAIPAIHCK